ncbi:MAG: flagellar export chaperone FlgN [Mariprofundaceae bacterium]
MGIIIANTVSDELQKLLEKMDLCTQSMETIIQQERLAMQSFNGTLIAELTEQRARCQSELAELESQCRRLLLQHNMPNDMSLNTFIEKHIFHHKEALQTKRSNLLVRMESMHQSIEDNRIRLHAAWRVTTHVLKEIGALSSPENYAQESYNQGATR